jgi:hypothetical protein
MVGNADIRVTSEGKSSPTGHSFLDSESYYIQNKKLLRDAINGGRYRAIRQNINEWVYGFVYRDINGTVQGILNENSKYVSPYREEEGIPYTYAELAEIVLDTLEKVPEDSFAMYKDTVISGTTDYRKERTQLSFEICRAEENKNGWGVEDKFMCNPSYAKKHARLDVLDSILIYASRENNELYEEEQKVIMFKDFDNIDIDSLVKLCLEREERAKSAYARMGTPEPGGSIRVKFSTPFLDFYDKYIGMRIDGFTVTLRVIDKENGNPYLSKITLGIPISTFNKTTFDYITQQVKHMCN